MAHKTLVEGTAYEISGGRTLIGGTGHEITGGKTTVDGTVYNISFAVAPTGWLLASKIGGTNGVVLPLHFYSNEVEYVSIHNTIDAVIYDTADGGTKKVYRLVEGRWFNQAYRTLIFIEQPSDKRTVEWLSRYGKPIA